MLAGLGGGFEVGGVALLLVLGVLALTGHCTAGIQLGVHP